MFAFLFPAAALAQGCTGPGLLDRLTPEARAALDARASAMPYPRGLFWQAERGGDVLTLIGTMHLPDPRHDALLARAKPVVEAADVLLLEMTPVEVEMMNRAMVETPERIYITEGPTLIDILPPEDWEAVAAAARDRMIPPFMAAKFRPWFLMITLSVPPCAMPAMASGEGGLDFALMDVAEAAGVPMTALEPWDTLFSLIDSTPEQDQIDLLRMGLMDPDLQTEMFVAMLDDYFAGEVARIWEMSRDAIAMMPGIDPAEADRILAMNEEVLLTLRNRAWIAGIEAAAAEHDRIVIAFGAAHLPGEEGVLRLLEAEGWRITPLP